MNRLSSFFNPDYLFATPTESTYEPYYLYLALFILILVLGLRVFFRFSSRSKVYLGFDRRWFYGYLALALSGVFLWFSRNQQLPTFGTRIFSYIWIALIFGYSFYLFFYYKKTLTKKLISYHEKKRKEKYLKR